MPRVAKASSKTVAKKLENLVEENAVASSTTNGLEEVVKEVEEKAAEEMAPNKGKGRGRKKAVEERDLEKATKKEAKEIAAEADENGSVKEVQAAVNDIEVAKPLKVAGKGRNKKVLTPTPEIDIIAKEASVESAKSEVVKPPKAAGKGRGRNKKEQPSELEKEENGDVKDESIKVTEAVEEELVKPTKSTGKARGRAKKEQPTVPEKEENGSAKDELEEAVDEELVKPTKAVVKTKAAETAEEEVAKPTKAKGRNKKEQLSVPEKDENGDIKDDTEKVAEAVEEEVVKPAKAAGKAKGRNKKEALSVPEKEENGSVEEEVAETIDEEPMKPTKAAPKTKGRKRNETTPTPSEASKPVEPASEEKEKMKKTKAAKIDKIVEPMAEAETSRRPRGKRPVTYKEEDLESEHEAAKGSRKRAKKEPAAAKPVVEKKKGAKAKPAAVAEIQDDEDAEDDEELAQPEKNEKAAVEKKSRGRKRAASVAEDEVVDGAKPTKAAKKPTDSQPLNATNTKYNKADFDLPPLEEGRKSEIEERYNLKISSWNVAGLRSWVKKDGLKFLEYEEPDIFCLQEIKCTPDQLPEEAERITGYHPYWLCMPGGYAGVAIYSKIMPIHVEYGLGVEEFDVTGRVITAEYEKFYLVNVYVPNSGRKLVNLEDRMRWEKHFQQFVQKLDQVKPVIICGDMNVSHLEIDLANPKSNTRNAGFTKEERDKMTELLALGYVDSFRHLYPERTGAYSFWTYMGNARARNVGWRLDYFLVAERLIKRVVENCMRSQVLGSDHCPITLFLKL